MIVPRLHQRLESEPSQDRQPTLARRLCLHREPVSVLVVPIENESTVPVLVPIEEQPVPIRQRPLAQREQVGVRFG